RCRQLLYNYLLCSLRPPWINKRVLPVQLLQPLVVLHLLRKAAKHTQLPVVRRSLAPTYYARLASLLAIQRMRLVIGTTPTAYIAHFPTILSLNAASTISA